MERRRHSAEFKKKVALEAIKDQKTIGQIAKEYKVHPIQVNKWKKQLLQGCGIVFEGKANRNDFEEDIAMLERKIGRLTVENDFLKKKIEA